MEYPETKLNAEDIYENKIDLQNFKSYIIGDKKLSCYTHIGQIVTLIYNSQEKTREMYDKIISIENNWEKTRQLHIKEIFHNNFDF
jgi:hypothetical protein